MIDTIEAVKLHTLAVFLVGVGITIGMYYLLKRERAKVVFPEAVETAGEDESLDNQQTTFSNTDKTSALLLVIGAALCLVFWITNSLGG